MRMRISWIWGWWMLIGPVVLCGYTECGNPSPCANKTCSGHGQCLVDQSAGTASCECEQGFHEDGLQCLADSVLTCAGLTCSGHGRCLETNGAVSCQCDAGFHASGMNCLSDTDPCTGVTCSDHGRCTAASGAAQCQCDEGFQPRALECLAGPPDGGSAVAECNAGTGGQFLKEGPYGSKAGIRGMGPFTYVPKSFGQDNCKYPVIAFSMGTGAPSSVYTGYYTFFASWGFVVVVDPTMSGQASGDTIKSALDWLYKSEYASKLSPKAGTTGHSQGGGGAFNASGHPNVQAMVGIQPGQFMCPKNTKPYLGLAGTMDMFGMTTNPLMMHWGASSGPKFYGNLEGADHIAATLNTGNGAGGSYYRAAATAWFRCFLASDKSACALFHSGKCDQIAGKWAECKGEKLP